MRTEEITIPSFQAVMTAVPGQLSSLTRLEFSLYSGLKAAAGRVVTHGALFDIMYGQVPECDQPDNMDIVKVYICKLRRKVPGIRIKTYWALGYALEE